MAYLPKISQKHSTSWSRKILPPSKRARVYWPNMEKDITFFIDDECPCLASKKQHIAPHAPSGL